MLDLRRVRYFVVVAEELHFGRAAQRLCIAQPPLTRHIAALEKELGMRLFERSTRAVALTPEGAAFLPRAKDVLAALEHAESAARRAAQGQLGRIAIGYASSVPLCDVFSSLIRDFGRQAPDVDLVFQETPSARQAQQLAAGALDIGFAWAGATGIDATLRSATVSREALVAAVPAASRHARAATLEAAQLAAETFILYPTNYGSTLNDAILRLCGDAGFAPQRGPLASQMTTLIALVAAERGVSIVPASVAMLRKPGVAYVPLAGDAAIELVALWRANESSAVVSAFVEFVEARQRGDRIRTIRTGRTSRTPV